MAEYTNDLRIKEIGIGEEAGAWGTTLNTQLGLLAEGFSYGVENLGSDANATITMADGASDEARSLYLKITSTSLSATRTVTLAPQSVSKVWIIENATTGSQSITITQGEGQHGVTIPNGQVKVVYSTGDSESPSGVYDAFDGLNLDGGAITAANGITSTAAANTFGATSFNDADITNVGSISLDTIVSDASPAAITIGYGNADTLTINGSTTITKSDNNAQLILVSTDADASTGPQLDLTRSSASPAASDTLGRIRFVGRDDGDNELSYGHMTYYIEDPANGAEDGKFEIDVRRNSTNRSYLMMNSTETVFNNEQVDIDFRVESDGDANMLLVDAGNNAVGIGTGSPTSPNSVNRFLHIHNADHSSLVMSDDQNTWEIVSNNNLTIRDGTDTRLTVDTSGTVGIGGSQEGLMFISSTDRFNLATADGLGIQLDKDNNRIAPVDASGTYNNNVSLGSSTLPFKDLHIDRIYGGTTTFTRDDNGAQLTLICTDTDASKGPILDLTRDNASAADGDVIGTIRFKADDSVNAETIYAQLNAEIVDVSNGTEDGAFIIKTMKAGSLTEQVRVSNTGTTTIGRVEGAATTDHGHELYHSGHYYQFADASGNSDAYRLYNASGTNTAAIDADGDYMDLSDERYKENIVDAPSVLDTISKMKIRSFNWKEDGRKKTYGFIAQELNEVASEAVSLPQDDEDVWGVKHARIVPMLTKAIQEQQIQIEALQAEVKTLKGE